MSEQKAAKTDPISSGTDKALSPKELALKGTVYSATNVVSSIVISIVQVRILLHCWSPREYGLWGSLFSAGNLALSISLGYQYFTGYRLLLEWYQSPESLSSIISQARRALWVFTGIQAIVALAAAWIGLNGVKMNLVAVVCLVIFVLVTSWPTGMWGILIKLYIPQGKYVRSIQWQLLLRILQFVATIIVAAIGFGAAGAIAGYALVTIICLCLSLHDAMQWRNPQALHGTSTLVKGQSHLVGSFVTSTVNLCDALFLNGMVLVVGLRVGLEAVPVFTTQRTLSNIAIQGVSLVFHPYQAEVVRYHVNRSHKALGNFFSAYWLILVFLYNPIVIILIHFLPSIYQSWTAGKLKLEAVLLASLFASVCLRSLGAPFSEYYAVTNQNRKQLSISVTRLLVVFSSAFLLAPNYGLVGIGVSILAGEIVAAVLIPASLFANACRLADGASFPTRSVRCAGASVMLVLFCLAIFGKTSKFELPLVSLALVTNVVVGAIMWVNADIAVKNGLLSIMTIAFKNLKCMISPDVAVT